MRAPEATHRTAGRALAATVLSLALGTLAAQTTPADGPAAGKTSTLLAAASPAAPAGVHVSPHARAARERAERERAAAQAGAGPSALRVSPFTTRRKPHSLASGR